jgi:hypothetical protein
VKGTVIRSGSTYSVVLDLGRGPDGRRVRKWHSGYGTKKDAEQARVELLAARGRGAYVEPSKLILAAFLREHWLPGLRAQVRPGTWAEHKSKVEVHLIPANGGCSFSGSPLATSMLSTPVCWSGTFRPGPSCMSMPRSGGRLPTRLGGA